MDMDGENKKVLMWRNWSWEDSQRKRRGTDLRRKPEANYSQEGQLETTA